MPLNRDWSQAPADVAVPAWRSHRTGTACPPKKAVREAASRLFHHTMHHRAGPPFAPPSISPQGSEPNGSGPTGAGCLTSLNNTSSPSWPDLVRPPTSCDPPRCQDVDPGSSPGMTARSLRAQHEKGRGARSSLSRVGEGWGEGRPVPDEAKPSVRLSAGRGASSSRAHPHLRSLPLAEREERAILRPISDRRAASRPLLSIRWKTIFPPIGADMISGSRLIPP